ncbi:SRPBCC family protein [Streptomyces arenae]|uniref:SRPBCC family protein n=1 Tax=Streptomyces arenae TaxID=29301 RepID=UPI002659D51C|nr:SRPBCC family protein [Streptomyces arenae]MCG7202551.1 SRPBCC family protein [Streptomyces arenae]
MNTGPIGDTARSEAVERLKAEVQEYLAAQAQRLLVGAGTKLGEATGKLTDIAEGNSPGFGKLALDAGRKVAEGKGPVRSALELGLSHAKDTVMDKVKNLGGGKGKGKGKGSGQKPTVIIESVDVGVPVRTAYDQWTRYQDFSTFAKGVKSAGRADDTTSDWQGKIWWSSRSWKGKTLEQVPDYRIQWSSEGAKGTHKGVVTFHRLDDNLTRILLVIEYYPSGFFEKTANIWRASGRRARLDLKHYARHISMKGEVDDGWRGEIRDGEVVVSHEDALAEEENAEDENAEGQDEESYEGEEPYDEAEEGPEEDDEEETEESDESGEPEEYEAEDDEDYEEDEEGEEEPEDELEDEEEYAESGSRR